MDPATLAINTVRGEAMHALISYALWIRRDLDRQIDPSLKKANNFDVMPEVREALDVHLDPSFDPTETTRSIYGRFFPWLVLLDQIWAKSNVQRIFPNDPQLSSLRDAAWITYISFCRAYDSAFEILYEEYDKAVERICTHPERSGILANPDEHLGEHLVTLYLRGKLNLDAPDSLLTKFYSRASEVHCAHVIKFLGMRLNEPTSIWDEIILQRLQALWIHRVTIARKTQPLRIPQKEYAQFGWWFISGKFDNKWSIEQLQLAIDLGDQPELVYQVIDRLAVLSPEMPLESIVCLAKLAECERRGFILLGRRENIKTILSSALRSEGEHARQNAISLVNRLGAKGLIEYGTLLSQTEEK